MVAAQHHNTTQHHATTRNNTQQHATPRNTTHTTQHHATPRNTTQHHATLVFINGTMLLKNSLQTLPKVILIL
jgi:hypothetical protein